MEDKYEEIKKDFYATLEHYGKDVDKLEVDKVFLNEFKMILDFCKMLMEDKRFLENQVNNYKMIIKEYKSIIAMFINKEE